MNSGRHFRGALAILVVVLIVNTEAYTRWCYCALKYNRARVATGNSIANLPVLKDLDNPHYGHWLSVPCKTPLKHCAYDCMRNAEIWLGSLSNPSSHFTTSSGQTACTAIGQHAPPSNKFYIYLEHIPSDCGGSRWEYLTTLSCCAKTEPGYHTTYVYNNMCENECPLR